MKDYYKILGVSENATQNEIDEAYVTQVVMIGSTVKQTGHMEIGKIALDNLTEAYKILSNPSNRKLYDKSYLQPQRIANSSVIDFMVKNIGKVCLMGFGILMFGTLITELPKGDGLPLSIVGLGVIGFCLILGFLSLKDKFEKENPNF